MKRKTKKILGFGILIFLFVVVILFITFAIAQEPQYSFLDALKIVLMIIFGLSAFVSLVSFACYLIFN